MQCKWLNKPAFDSPKKRPQLRCPHKMDDSALWEMWLQPLLNLILSTEAEKGYLYLTKAWQLVAKPGAINPSLVHLFVNKLMLPTVLTQ